MVNDRRGFLVCLFSGVVSVWEVVRCAWSGDSRLHQVLHRQFGKVVEQTVKEGEDWREIYFADGWTYNLQAFERAERDFAEGRAISMEEAFASGLRNYGPPTEVERIPADGDD